MLKTFLEVNMQFSLNNMFDHILNRGLHSYVYTLHKHLDRDSCFDGEIQELLLVQQGMQKRYKRMKA